MGSNTEKILWTNLQNWYKNEEKRSRATTYAIAKFEDQYLNGKQYSKDPTNQSTKRIQKVK